MRSLRPLAASGLSNLSDNPTLPPDEGPPLSSGQQLEPDDNKPLTYAGYSGHRRVRRVLCKRGATNKKWRSARLLAVLFFVHCSSCPGGVVSDPVVD
jgi:hypothetical protein